jgi:Zn-dependent M28 family amino/carboxypeptidase
MLLNFCNKYIALFFLFFSHNLNAQNADTSRILQHLTAITELKGFRNFQDTNALNEVAGYIYDDFTKYADTVFYQYFFVGNVRYKNVIARINSNKKLPTIVLGAHYDVCGLQKGADDNASGVVGLLETGRLLWDRNLNYAIELVAYTLEEPPFFRTEFMGSNIHAEKILNNESNVYGMISLEMIGYFSDDEHSQDYPLRFLKLFYGTKGNYITLVNRFNKGEFARSFTKSYSKNEHISTKKFTGPQSLTGIDFSDHMNYWNRGISALMLTDTAFYRNKNYHESGDTIESLDSYRMSKVIDALVETLLNLK